MSFGVKKETGHQKNNFTTYMVGMKINLFLLITPVKNNWYYVEWDGNKKYLDKCVTAVSLGNYCFKIWERERERERESYQITTQSSSLQLLRVLLYISTV